jgi:hypothetical protein
MVVAMDALALNLKTGRFSPVSGRNSRLTATWRLPTRIGEQWTEKSRKARSLSLTVVCASGKKKSNGPPFSGLEETTIVLFTIYSEIIEIGNKDYSRLPFLINEIGFRNDFFSYNMTLILTLLFILSDA